MVKKIMINETSTHIFSILFFVLAGFLFQRRSVRKSNFAFIESIANLPLIIGGIYLLSLILQRQWDGYEPWSAYFTYAIIGIPIGWTAGIISRWSQNKF